MIVWYFLLIVVHPAVRLAEIHQQGVQNRFKWKQNVERIELRSWSLIKLQVLLCFVLWFKETSHERCKTEARSDERRSEEAEMAQFWPRKVDLRIVVQSGPHDKKLLLDVNRLYACFVTEQSLGNRFIDEIIGTTSNLLKERSNRWSGGLQNKSGSKRNF